MTRAQEELRPSFFCFILLAVITTMVAACPEVPDDNRTLGEAGGIIRQHAEKARPALRGQRLRVSGTLVAADGNGPTSCACWFVCDGNGENCTECECDPVGCGSCE